MENVSVFDKITVMVAGIILLIFIVTIIISKVRYEWQREELDAYWSACRDDHSFETINNNGKDDKKRNNRDCP